MTTIINAVITIAQNMLNLIMFHTGNYLHQTRGALWESQSRKVLFRAWAKFALHLFQTAKFLKCSELNEEKQGQKQCEKDVSV